MRRNLGFLTNQNRHLGNRIFEKMIRDSGIDAFSGAQGRILYVLWENGTLSISEICKLTSLANSTMTNMLDQMERNGTIVRLRNPENRKQILISLTEKAKGYKKEYDDLSDRMNDLTYKGFTEEELSLYESFLKRVKSNLEEYEEER